jgi:hypothetical protein
MKVTSSHSDTNMVQSARDRRKAKRVALSFPIEVSGVDSRGRPFCESLTTTDVSEDGCGFNTLREMRCGDIVTILVSTPSSAERRIEPVRFQIVWVEASQWGWAIGASKLQPVSVWPMGFPKAKQS